MTDQAIVGIAVGAIAVGAQVITSVIVNAREKAKTAEQVANVAKNLDDHKRDNRTEQDSQWHSIREIDKDVNKLKGALGVNGS